MGSHGTKAVAAAVLGAKATCVDISPVNAAYCAEVAAAAGVNVEFVVADVLNLPPDLNGEKRNTQLCCVLVRRCSHMRSMRRLSQASVALSLLLARHTTANPSVTAVRLCHVLPTPALQPTLNNRHA